MDKAERSHKNVNSSGKWIRVFFGFLFGSVWFLLVPIIKTSRHASSEDIRNNYVAMHATGTHFLWQWLVFVSLIALVAYYWERLLFERLFDIMARYFGLKITLFFSSIIMVSLLITLKKLVEFFFNIL